MTSAVGKALGKDAEAKSLITELEGKLAAAGEANPVFKDTTFIAGNLEPADGGINLYASGDNRPRFLSALGMTQAKIVDENVKAGEFYLPWSAERANELDSDIFFTWIPAGSSDHEDHREQALRPDPGRGQGRTGAVDSDMDVLAVSATSPLSIQWAIDKVVPKLAAAAQAATGK